MRAAPKGSFERKPLETSANPVPDTGFFNIIGNYIRDAGSLVPTLRLEFQGRCEGGILCVQAGS